MMARINQFMEENFKTASHQPVLVGGLAVFGFPFIFYLWGIWLPHQVDYVPWGFKFVVSALGFGLILIPFLPKSFHSFIPWYWFISLLYILSFFFTYSFFVNRANDLSSMSLLSSIFLLVLLVNFTSLVIMLALGFVSALLAYSLTVPEIYFDQEHIEVAILGILFVVAGSTVNYRTAVLQKQRMKGMAAAAGMIAHELRTPLLGIKSGAQALNTTLPELFDAYRIAHQKGLLEKPIRATRLQQLKGVNQRIIHEINYANTVIDMLLVKAGRDNYLQNCELEPCSMAEVITEALERYPFRSEEERQLVHWEGDFAFLGSKLLMQHVIFNLVKNALYAIVKAEKGAIYITTSADEHSNYLHVKDTALGMTQKQLKQLFNHFYTTTFMGTGIGLSFCKLVMERFGGEITCDAEAEVYTEFILQFPKVGIS